MKTWRERLAEDQAIGRPGAASLGAWADPCRCPVGVGVARFGFEPFSVAWVETWDRLNGPTILGLSGRFLKALQAPDFAEADRILDEIDDRVLELKREAGS